ncbi:hypothetical protein Cgig2_014375 [Carnegiea gigantea]|uniref:Uncharacterized protein n=1 Tax=Carnegiea gigantea TaxID=171969 RepID=A0A9Q1KFI7_9CARY|nr:hypothetical protein Cgig2_014375 [Carnegiea gigantea]
MEKIKDKDISAFHWLRDNEPLEHWLRFKFDQTLKINGNTNNFVESFNNAIVKHREKPTYTMKLYDGIIHPVPDSCFWGGSELPTLDPPFEPRKRGRPEKHKRRKNRLPIPDPSITSTIQLSGTKRCKKCKQLGHNSLTCGRPRDENGRLKYKKKPVQKTGNLVGRLRKIQRVRQASTSTAAASRV